MASSVESEVIQPVPSQQAVLNGELLSHEWMQWFVNLREKVNVINEVLVSLGESASVSDVFEKISPLSARGDLLSHDGTVNIRVGADSDGKVLSLVSGIPSWVGFSSVSPLTTRGDLLVHDGLTGTRLPVGSNGDLLVADSSEPEGLKWSPVLAVGTLGAGVHTDGSLSFPTSPTTAIQLTLNGVTYLIPAFITD